MLDDIQAAMHAAIAVTDIVAARRHDGDLLLVFETDDCGPIALSLSADMRDGLEQVIELACRDAAAG